MRTSRSAAPAGRLATAGSRACTRDRFRGGWFGTDDIGRVDAAGRVVVESGWAGSSTSPGAPRRAARFRGAWMMRSAWLTGRRKVVNDQPHADPNEFSASRVPGQLGMEILEAGREGVVARLRVTPPMIMGYGFVIAAVVVGLARTVCGYRAGPPPPPGGGFTTIQVKEDILRGA